MNSGLRITIGVLLSVFTFMYMLPAGIAIARGRANAGAIFALDLFLGWTLIGWVIAFVWAVADDPTKVRTTTQTPA